MSETERKTLKEAVEKLQETKKQLIVMKKQLDALIDGKEEEKARFTRVDLATSRMSSMMGLSDKQQWSADKATDGYEGTSAKTSAGMAPWYSAQLGVRFSAIRLNITGTTSYATESTTIFTVDEGVETECETRGELGKFSWTVECPNTGTGFKIMVKRQPESSFSPYLTINEVTVEIQQDLQSL